MARVEVEGILDAKGEGRGMDDARSDYRGIPVLKLRVGFESKVMGQVIVEAGAGGVDGGVGTLVNEGSDEEAGSVVVDLTTPEEEIDVWVKAADRVLDFGA